MAPALALPRAPTQCAGSGVESSFGGGACLGIAPNYLVTLEVLGRRSGRRTSFPLVMVVVDGERYLVSMLGRDVAWVQNLRAAEGHALLRHGRTERVRLEEIPVEQRGTVLRTTTCRAKTGSRRRISTSAPVPTVTD
jgi:hypothetical protein